LVPLPRKRKRNEMLISLIQHEKKGREHEPQDQDQQISKRENVSSVLPLQYVTIEYLSYPERVSILHRD
jgi:hypothetical protein